MDNSEKNFTLLRATEPAQVPAAVENAWCSIFNTPQFFGLHAAGRRACFFSLRDEASRQIVGRVHFMETAPGHFASPFRGTFGGFEAAGTDMRLLEGFVQGTESQLAELGAKSLEVALKPFAHAPALSACLFNVLTRRGYALTVCDLSYAQAVAPGSLVDRMERNNQKKVRKCQREGFVFARVEAPADCQAAYEAVAANRAARGYPISMTYPQITAMVQAFPGCFHFFTVTQAGKVIAGAVCIAVSREVLYVFYWGDVPGYETFSPVVLLAEGIYAFAQEKGFRLYDVGRSTENGVPNPGLIRFKEKLGFEASLKLTFRKQL